mgnify:CR=1 FL=1
MLTLISQAALFTMMYSDSLARFVFEGDENFSGSYLSGAGESGYKITLSLAILALPSMFSGFFFKDLFIGFGSFTFADAIFLLPTNAHFFESDYMLAVWRVAPVVSSFFTIFLIIFGFDFLQTQVRGSFEHVFLVLKSIFGGFLAFIVDFFSLNWFFDAALNYWAVTAFTAFCRETTFKLLDKGLLEVFGPYSILNVFSVFSKKVAAATSGYIFHYSFLIIFGVSLLLLLNFFVFESLAVELFFTQIFLSFTFLLNFSAETEK